MSNHFHILLEVPPMPEGGISDSELLRRLGVFCGENFVQSVGDELVAARSEGGVEGGNAERVVEIRERFTKRMHDLSEFMKTLLQRFTRWFNRTHNRTGTLWNPYCGTVPMQSEIGEGEKGGCHKAHAGKRGAHRGPDCRKSRFFLEPSLERSARTAHQD